MNKTKIEWTDYTWNPIVGCKNGCWYCYAKKLNDRFKFVKDWTEPSIFPERLIEPYKLKKPSKIFVCSMSDLFGSWVDKKIIKEIIGIAKENPQHTFQFLTKNSQRYSEFYFPKNCWLGMTIDKVKAYTQVDIEFLRMNRNYTFISFEPLLEDMGELWLKGIDLVIVGAMTGPGAIKPQKEWIKSIKHKNIFYKDSIKKLATQNTLRKV